ncbi:MAG: hypothetical protein E6J90_05450 [Deltaproteobacteria bacterium]|nr:MAG: hypothetical protein E6J91_20555 [Deltaproteobacteria bacterium]TMQ25682.1 MAG: hypothetical protein E6J90_05450 [Deltaproteobacteria bacterium]
MGTHRRWINAFLVGFLAIVAIDAFHGTGCTQPLKDAVNLPLLVTGLWQGPWRLYAPDVDKDNLQLKAELVFADQATATWSSPDWAELSALRKFRLARHINYYNAILLADRELAWDDLCAYLARSVPHPQGKAVAVAQITLSLRGARIPPPDEKIVPAGPYRAFDPWEVIRVWRPRA